MKIPSLLLLGKQDRRVPFAAGMAFRAMNKDCKLFVYEESNHSLADSVETTLDCTMKQFMFLV